MRWRSKSTFWTTLPSGNLTSAPLAEDAATSAIVAEIRTAMIRALAAKNMTAILQVIEFPRGKLDGGILNKAGRQAGHSGRTLRVRGIIPLPSAKVSHLSKECKKNFIDYFEMARL